jgi:hypothetical protein
VRASREWESSRSRCGSAWFRTIPAAYYLETEVPLEATLAGWVEALDVDVQELLLASLTPDSRSSTSRPEDAAVNDDMRSAIRLAERLRRRGGDLERASHELLAAANDASAQGLLSAFRAMECLRRTYEPRFDRRKRGWTLMAQDLTVDDRLLGLLAEAAEAVRHGEVPPRQRARHPVNVARRRRDEFLKLVRDAVTEAVAKKVGVVPQQPQDDGLGSPTCPH